MAQETLLDKQEGEKYYWSGHDLSLTWLKLSNHASEGGDTEKSTPFSSKAEYEASKRIFTVIN